MATVSGVWRVLSLGLTFEGDTLVVTPYGFSVVLHTLFATDIIYRGRMLVPDYVN